MNLPENYVVICTTEKETNEVVTFIETQNTKNWQHWKYVTISNNEWNIYNLEESVTKWFNNQHNISDYKTFTFKEWKEMKENKFPEKWAILATEENFKEISDFYVKHTDNDSTYKGDFWLNQYFHSHNSRGNKINQMTEIGFSFVEKYVKEGFELISFEQFKEHVLNQKSKSMQKLTISVTELLEIHIIACLSWKSKIANYLTRVDENQNIRFTQKEVDEMFEAATADQKPTLIKIFGEKQNPIEWDKIKTGSKVMLKETGKICNTTKNVDFTKEFDVVFYNTPYLISSSNKFSKEGVCEKYCTFHQDSKFVLFDANKIDYITKVIEY